MESVDFLDLEGVVPTSPADESVQEFLQHDDSVAFEHRPGRRSERGGTSTTNGQSLCIPEVLGRQFDVLYEVLSESQQQTNRLASLCHDYCRNIDNELAYLRDENSELREQLGNPSILLGGSNSHVTSSRTAMEGPTLGVPDYKPPEVPCKPRAPLPAEGAPPLAINPLGEKRDSDTEVELIPFRESDASSKSAGTRNSDPPVPTLNTLVDEDVKKIDTVALAPLRSRHSTEPLQSQYTKHGTLSATDTRGGGSLLKLGPQAQKGKFEVVSVWKIDKSSRRRKENGATGGKGRHANSLFKDQAAKDHHAMVRSDASAEIPTIDEDESSPTPTKRRVCSLTEWIVIHPNSPKRGAWDILSLFLVVYDMIYIPMQFFDPPNVGFVVFMTWTTRIFWTLDVGFSFTTGYVTNDGFIVLQLSKIVPRYLKSWFILDVLVVGSDWLEIILSAGGSLGFARLGKASRTIRIIRMLRLLRLARMREVLAVISERIMSEKIVILADIMKILFIVVGLAHFIACIWYGIGITEGEPPGWVEAHDYARQSFGNRYSMALHWSIAQFAGGMDEVTPSTLGERVFAICIFLLAFIVASVFVSSITSSMTQLNIIGSHQSQHLSILRRYLHQNGIPNKLAVRVQRNAQYAVTEQQRMLPESSVKYLQLVSEPLRVEIHLEMYAPIFMIHPFFETYLSECPQVMRKVCHLATSTMNLSAGDVVFSAGETPSQPKMYIVMLGCLEYSHLNGEKVPILEKECVAEASLWCHWVHQGVLSARSDARLCVVDAKKFQSIAHQFEHNEFDPKVYANDFVKKMNGVQDPSDVADHHPELQESSDCQAVQEKLTMREKKKDSTSSFWSRTPIGAFLERRKKRVKEQRIAAELKRAMTDRTSKTTTRTSKPLTTGETKDSIG